MIDTTDRRRILRFDGPSPRTFVEVWTRPVDGYSVIATDPYPPPTRGVRVTHHEVDTHAQALALAADLVRGMLVEMEREATETIDAPTTAPGLE